MTKGAMPLCAPIFAKGNLLLGTLSVTFPVLRQEEYDTKMLICLLKDVGIVITVKFCEQSTESNPFHNFSLLRQAK